MSYYGNLYQNEELSHRAKTVYMVENLESEISFLHHNTWFVI